ETPFSQGVLRIGSLVLAHDKLSVIAATVILCALLYLFFNRTTLGTAMRASSENMLAAYYMGIPVKRVVSIVWAIAAAVATAARGAVAQAGRSVRPSCAQEGLREQHALHLQDRLRRRHPAVSAFGLCLVLRRAAGIVGDRTVRAVQLPDEPAGVRLHLRHRRR